MRKTYNFSDIATQAKFEKKTYRQVFIEQEAEAERQSRGNSQLIKDHAKSTQVFKDGMASQFPIDAFQVLDLTINLPLNKYFAQEMVPMRLGGGAVESFAFFRSNIALAEGRLAGGNTNEVPVVGISDEKITIPVYPITLGIVLGTIDLMKSETINYDILERHEFALRESYWREIEYFAFEGNVNIGDITTATSNFFPGLLNIPVSGAGIYYSALNGADWSAYGVEEWTTLLVGSVGQMKKNLRYNRDYFPNTIAVGPSVWTLMQQPAVVGDVSTSGGAGIALSIMGYVSNEINKRLGINVEFVELPYLDAGAKTTDGFFVEASGANSEGRILVYRKDEKVVKMPITMPLTGGATLPSPTEGGLRKNYVAFASPLAIVYPEAIGYIDNDTGE